MIGDFFESFARSLGWFFGSVVGRFVFASGYYIGWPFVKCITLGYYPSKRRRYLKWQSFQEIIWTSCIGLLIVISAGVYFLI